MVTCHASSAFSSKRFSLQVPREHQCLLFDILSALWVDVSFPKNSFGFVLLDDLRSVFLRSVDFYGHLSFSVLRISKSGSFHRKDATSSSTSMLFSVFVTVDTVTKRVYRSRPEPAASKSKVWKKNHQIE
ncbi:hypothetical protein SRHO_G00236880 [Serrasalmus rhombeus]